MAIHQSNRAKITNHIQNREPFHIASMSAEIFQIGHSIQIGRLPEFESKVMSTLNGMYDVYVVYSYNTPIGCLALTEQADWYIPPRNYSATTTQHQGILRAAILPNSPY